ncbi:type II toxin-antitoxin system Phd/YefM family antitoxin [Rhizobium sp. T1470]|nr:type II toxin-antitoxin system Phd/YefM family antitoxin [Rhizobium sp. T1473]
MDRIFGGISAMKTMSAKDAKNAFGMLIDHARAEPVAVEKHGRKVVVVLAVEEFERLTSLAQMKTDEDENVRKKAVK